MLPGLTSGRLPLPAACPSPYHHPATPPSFLLSTPQVILPLDKPIKSSGHIQILYGNLSPEGSGAFLGQGPRPRA